MEPITSLSASGLRGLRGERGQAVWLVYLAPSGVLQRETGQVLGRAGFAINTLLVLGKKH